MIKYFQKRYVMSEKGAKDLLKAIVWNIIGYISFMFPVMIICSLISSMFTDLTLNINNKLIIYTILSFIILVIMYIIQVIVYDKSYTTIYEESAKVRIKLAEKLKQLPLAFFGKKDISDLSSTIMEDATTIETLFSHAIPQLYSSIITIGFMSIMMALFNLKMTLSVIWVVPVVFIIFKLSAKKQVKVHEQSYIMKRNIGDVVQENIENVYDIKAYNLEENKNKILNEALDDYEKELIRGEILVGTFINFSYIPLYLGMPSVIFYGGYSYLNGSIDFFTYCIFLIIASRIYIPLLGVANNFALLQFLNVRIERMREMENMPIQSGSSTFEPKTYDIEFKNVSFSYGKDSETIRNISFLAKQGEVTSLVGPSGGGKSTVAKLAARFWDIQKGEILLGGTDISKIDPEKLLEYYSIVFQDVTLFNSSIIENIRLGRKNATDDEVKKAAELAQCSDFIDKMKDGYNTEIGENGEMLSGGERQRISIARAILKDAPIILMDEATASLDTQNETKVQKALNTLIKNKTVIIIAHRMRTVINTDKIIVIKNGEIAESGNPNELKNKNGIFSSMLSKN